MGDSWVVRTPSTVPIDSVQALCDVLCQARGVESAAQSVFFTPTYEEAIHDPHLLVGMGEAVDRIFSARDKGESILVWGDYDADGITSTAQIISTLRELGVSAVPYLPHRMDDGYGLNLKVLKNLVAEADLVITVDCGVANVEEIAWLKKKKVDVIVVDHHEIGEELPPARAILHPRHPDGKYPWGYLAGAGVTWKLCQALLRDTRSGFHNDKDKEKWLLDLTVLGTVADIVPLQNENRAIVQFGLEVLRRSRRPGIRALLDKLKISPSTLVPDDVGFKIVPRLNAPGRVEHPQPALDLLLASDAESATRYALGLEGYNTKRQAMAKKVMKEAEEQVVHEAPFVFAFSAAWPAGIVGLAANQLARKFSRPAIVVGSNGRHAVGSARCPDGFNILSILETGREHLMALGGHAQAAGFSVAETSINALYATLLSSAQKKETDVDPQEQTMIADAVIEPSLLSWQLAEMVQKLAPFGKDNDEPLFIIKRLPLLRSVIIGKTKTHAKFMFDVPGHIDAIGFGLADRVEALGDFVDVVAGIKIDHYGGRPRLQLQIKEILPAGKSTIEVKEQLKQEAKV